MTTYYRRDDEVQNGLGQAMPNIAVSYLVQPGLTLATVYADSIGTPATNPQYTNGLGQAAAYMLPGLYTVSYSGAQIQTLTYSDQLVGGGAGVGNRWTVTPAPNGSTRIFTLSGPASLVPSNDQMFQSGSLVPYTNYTVSPGGITLTWTAATPPQTGDLLEYFTN